MDTATVTIICGCILGLMQAYTTYRLKEQDNARDAARAEMVQVAANVKTEAEKAAFHVANKVETEAENTRDRLSSIQVLVDGRMTEALGRVQALEAKLGLMAGEDIPNPPDVQSKAPE